MEISPLTQFRYTSFSVGADETAWGMDIIGYLGTLLRGWQSWLESRSYGNRRPALEMWSLSCHNTTQRGWRTPSHAPRSSRQSAVDACHASC